MAENDHSAEDRTEAATARRLEQARASGQLPISREMTTLAGLGGAASGLMLLAPALMRRVAENAADTLSSVGSISLDTGTVLARPLTALLQSAALLVAAVGIPAAVCAILSVLVQTNFYIGGSPIRFDPGRISPRSGLARILSFRNAIEFGKSCLRLATLSLLAWSVLSGTPGRVLAALGLDPAAMLGAARDQTGALVKPLLIALTCFVGADIFLVRFQHARSLRMTREQVRLESRETEGDPFIKARLRRIRMQRARRRMMAKVRTADVVITNPTHYAVALTYERSSAGAPRVVAKGADFVAAKIREQADQHGVPIVSSPPLARALFLVQLDHEIPAEHYRAVAEIIAYVWKLNTRAGRTPAS